MNVVFIRDLGRRNLPIVAGPLMNHFPGMLGDCGFIKPGRAAPLSPWQHGTHIDSLPKQPPQEYSPKLGPLMVIR